MRNTHPAELTYRTVNRDGRLFHLWSDGTLLPVVRGGDGPTEGLTELLARASDVTALGDDELAQLDADLQAAAEAAAEGDVTPEVLEQLEQAGTVCQAIRAEQESREQDAADRAARAEAALAAIRGEQADPDGGDGEDGDGDADADADADTEAENPPEVLEPEADADAEDAELVAASAQRRAPRVTNVAARRPASRAPRTVTASAGDPFAGMSLVAAANAPGVQAGQPIRSYDDLARVFVSAVEATKGYRHGPRVKVPVVRSEAAYPETHTLGLSIQENQRKIEAAQAAIQRGGGLQASLSNGVQAAGGICAPTEVRYDLPVLGVDDRPVRDRFLTRFGADRGGVRTLPPPVIGDLAGSVDNWTAANDENPADPTTKPCLAITCPDEDETVVEAITRCLEYGNFRARYFPEQVEAWMRLAQTWHARFAEQRLLAAITAGSKVMTVGQTLGTTRSVLAGLDRAIATWRSAHRDPRVMLEFGGPFWLIDQMRSDIARQLPVGTVEETLAVADATIERFFVTRGVEWVPFLDGESGQQFTMPTGDDEVPGWPSTARTYLAPAGSWLFLDGGSLDLGIVRDSTLNSTNDVQVFAETFEGAHFHGVDSWVVSFDTCPDGSVSATVDIDPCTTGS